MGKLYERDWKYSCGRIWTDTAIRGMFSDISSEGKENIPTDGAVIFAPNHCNTLMDALVILQDHKEATLFGARADIFRKPFVNKLLRFLRIVPLPRARDGSSEVLRNHQTMEEVVDCLDHGMKYCMFCEGTHRAMHSLLPLKKGIARIALLANQRFAGRKKVYIVPTGIEYQDYFRARTPVSIRYGEAINVTDFVSSRPGAKEGRLYRELLDLLRERISSLITCLPDDESYEGRWSLAKIGNRESAISADGNLITEAAGFERERKAAMLSSWSFSRGRKGLHILGKVLLGLILSPVILFATVAAAPMWLLSTWITRGLKDKAFARTACFGVKFAMTPLMLLIWALVFFIFLPMPTALVAFFLAILSHRVFYEALERGRVLLSDIRLYFSHKDLKNTYFRLSEKAMTVSLTNQTQQI